jgi:hypothetical protein
MARAAAQKDIKELDDDRRIETDGRDPRAQGLGPCSKGKHLSWSSANRWGRWWDCQRCGLRLCYIPYKTSPGQSTHVDNPGNVLEALERLQKDGDYPEEMDGRVVKTMIKIVAEEKKLREHINKQKAKIPPKQSSGSMPIPPKDKKVPSTDDEAQKKPPSAKTRSTSFKRGKTRNPQEHRIDDSDESDFVKVEKEKNETKDEESSEEEPTKKEPPIKKEPGSASSASSARPS